MISDVGSCYGWYVGGVTLHEGSCYGWGLGLLVFLEWLLFPVSFGQGCLAWWPFLYQNFVECLGLGGDIDVFACIFNFLTTCASTTQICYSS